jgi:phage FluMu protein Com
VGKKESKPLQCVGCGKFLGEVMFDDMNIAPSSKIKKLTKPAIEIKCNRCKTYNMITST